MTDLSQLSDAELEQQIRSLEAQIGPTVDTGEGAPAGVRAVASFKSTPEERFSYFQRAFGQENVSKDPQGKVLWRKPGEKVWHPIDEPGFSLADIADFAGDVPEMLGASVGAVIGAGGGSLVAPGPGTLAAGVKGAAIGGAGGNVLKQLISAAFLPGEETARPLERAGDVGLAGALSGVGQFVGGKIAQKLAMGAASKGAATAYEKEGVDVLKSLGSTLPPDIQPSLTAAQLSGNQGIRILEDMNRRNFMAATIYSERELQNQIKPVLHRTEQIMDKLVSGGVPDLDLGSALKQSFDRASKMLTSAMYDNAAKNFAFLDKATGGVPIIPINNFKATLAKVAQDAGRPGTPPGPAALAKQAADLLDDINRAAPQGLASAADVQRWLSTYGRRGYSGTGVNIFKDVDKAADQFQAKAFFRSLLSDLDAAASATTTMPAIPGTSGLNISRFLKEARDSYRVDREALRELERSMLGRKLGKDIPLESTERLAEWARKLRPPELEAAMSILEVSRPNIRQLTARNFLENALEIAKRAGEESSQTLAKAPLSMQALLKALPEEKTMTAIMGKEGKDVVANVKVLEEFLRRATQRTESTSSLQNIGLFHRIAALGWNPALAGRVGWSIMFPKMTARLLTDPEALTLMRNIRFAGNKFTASTMNKMGKIVERLSAPVAVMGEPEY